MGRTLQRPQSGWFPTLGVAGASLPLPTTAPPSPGSEEVGTRPEVCGQGHRKAEKNETFLVWLLSSKLVLFPSSVSAELCIFRVLVSQEYSLMVILNAPQGPRCRLEREMRWTRAAALRWGKRFAREIHRTAPGPARAPRLYRNCGSIGDHFREHPEISPTHLPGGTHVSWQNKQFTRRAALPAKGSDPKCPVAPGCGPSSKAQPPSEPDGGPTRAPNPATLWTC